MLTLDVITSVAEGMAWAADVRPATTGFNIDITLPFPFYEALQRELMAQAAEMTIERRDPYSIPMDMMRILDVTLPSGIIIHLKKGDRAIIFERTPAKVIPITKQQPGSQLLFPFHNNGLGNSDMA